MIENQRFGSESLPAYPGRYRLVVSPLCPWCRRTTIARRLLGLQSIIAVTYASGSGPDGFEFTSPGKSYNLEIQARTNRELYRRQPQWQDGDPTSVPVMLDSKQNNAIVANESANILRDLGTVFKPYWEWGTAELYPEAKRGEIDAINEELATEINRPTGKIVHNSASESDLASYRAALAKLDERLTETPFLLGDEPLESDIRLFVSLQSVVVKDKTLVTDYPHLARYFNELCARPGWVSKQENLALGLGLPNCPADGPSGLSENEAGDDAAEACSTPACSSN